VDVNAPWAAAVTHLAARILGADTASHIAVEAAERIDHSLRGYRYACEDGELRVSATDAVSASVGLRAYLRDECGVDVQWATLLPLCIELVDAAPTAGTARVAEQYALNFCTYGYTTAHWGWAEWEREIDWMALHGVTMPLALVGHEAVLFEAWVSMGLTADQALAFLGDPIYLPWQFMGCIEGERAVMTEAWLERRLELGRRILSRCRDLGMRPVAPAFTGHVPATWADGGSRSRDWQGNTTWFLDPADERFTAVAETVARIQRRLLGEISHFAADPFIEMPPTDRDGDFPAEVGRAIFAGIGRVAERPVWVLQAWPFSYQREYWTRDRVRAFLSARDDDQLLVLDLWAEEDPVWPHHDAYGGKPWLWCGLLNFGGRSDAVADLRGAHAELERALAAAHPPRGIGLSMESSRHNTVFFELVCDLAWGPVTDLGTWIGEFGVRRYGRADDRVRNIWRSLLGTVYDAGEVRIFPEDFHGILTRRPDAPEFSRPADLRTLAATMRWFDPEGLLGAWRGLEQLLAEEPDLIAGPLGVDLVEVIQAASVRVVDELAARVLEATTDRDASVGALLDFLSALDGLLAVRPESRLESAERAAADDATDGVEADDLVRAQRRILSTWNPSPGTALDDYAARIWSGLVGGYYRERLAAWARSLDGDPELLAAELDAIENAFVRDGASAATAVTDIVTASADLRARAEATLTTLIGEQP
jgi:alpha-N-acetylglucosaminidase